MINADSIKARLKNHATKYGKTMQEQLVAYGLERTIYRISISEYADRFTLKGGILMYALFEGDFPRVTRDIDLLANRINADSTHMKRVFTDVFSQECEDALIYDLETLNIHSITEFKEYSGVNVSIMAYLDRTRIPISIDIGFGDIVYPDRTKIEFPALLGMESSVIYAYSVSSVIAEKFEAIVSLGYINSRFKDFYDIYSLALKYELDGNELKDAIKETFSHRGTGFSDIVAFEEGFAKDQTRIKRWEAFIKKKKAMTTVSFCEVVDLIKELLKPVVEAILAEQKFDFKWSSNEKVWR